MRAARAFGAVETAGRSATVPAAALGAEGVYRVRLCALGNSMQQSKTGGCALRVVLAAAFTMSASAVNPGLDSPVTFQISGAVGAAKVRLTVDAAEYGPAASVAQKTGTATIRQAFHVSGSHSIALQLYRNGAWEDSGAGAKSLTVNSAAMLAAPVLVKPAGGALSVAYKKSATVAWKSVAGAKRYLLRLYNPEGALAWSAETAKLSVKLTKDVLNRRGVLRLEICALGGSAQRSQPGALCAITVR